MSHVPVMLKECLEIFQVKTLKTFFDGTLGAGGFARALLTSHPEIDTYFACDRDENALEIAQENLTEWSDKVSYIHGNFCDLDQHLEERGVRQVDGFFLTWECHPCN